MARKKKKKNTVVQVIDGKLNVRKEPSLDSEIVRVLDDESIIDVESFDDSWYKVEDGYVMKEFTIIVESVCDGNMEDTK